MKAWKSTFQRHQYSVKALSTTAFLASTYYYIFINHQNDSNADQNRSSCPTKTVLKEHKKNVSQPTEKKDYIHVAKKGPEEVKKNNDQKQSPATSPAFFDVGHDGMTNHENDHENDHEHDAPRQFLNEFILTRKNENSSRAAAAAAADNGDGSNENTSSTDAFKMLFPPHPQSFDKQAQRMQQKSSSSKEKKDHDNYLFLPPNVDSIIETTMSNMTETLTELRTGQVSDRALNELINHARKKAQQPIHSGDGTDIPQAAATSQSYTEVINIIMNDIEKVKLSLTKNFIQVFDQLDIIDPTSIFYYLEHEDEIKNPSWKRRMHRFCQMVDLNQVNYLNDALKLAELSYADSVGEIKRTLEDGVLQIGKDLNDTYELVHCQLESYPGKPSHYLAVKRGQSIWTNSLEIVLVVRGTKTVPDMLTDALLDATDYKGGKAHAGILESGKYLVNKHSAMMESLLRLSKKKQIKLFIVGHSLGAGASTIVGMELRENSLYDISVIGFGCPALLSKDLSESTSSYVTTVIGDSDIVPRMSAATIGNVILNILEYDWTSKAKRDVNQALHELFFQNTSFLFNNETIQSILKSIDAKIMNLVKTRIKPTTKRRVEPILFPPGNCIHFYRDGIAVSGAFTPATFFKEIDISRTMVDDHSISGYRRIFLDVMRNFHRDDHFSFENKR